MSWLGLNWGFLLGFRVQLQQTGWGWCHVLLYVSQPVDNRDWCWWLGMPVGTHPGSTGCTDKNRDSVMTGQALVSPIMIVRHTLQGALKKKKIYYWQVLESVWHAWGHTVRPKIWRERKSADLGSAATEVDGGMLRVLQVHSSFKWI